MKKKLLKLLSLLACGLIAVGLSACGNTTANNSSPQEEQTQIEQIYAQYVFYAESRSQTPLSYENWLQSIKGEKGDTGAGVKSVHIDENGLLVITLTDGTVLDGIEMPSAESAESLRYQKIAGKEEYRVMGMGTVSDLDIVIPATYRGLPITEIGQYAFQNEVYIESISIGENITSIASSAFAYCSSLLNVTIPDSVTTIGKGAFAGCSSLTEIKFEGTIEQWNTIEKGSLWNLNVPAEKFICSNGEVEL